MRALVLALLVAAIHVVLALVYCQETPYRTPGKLMNSFDPVTRQHVRIADVGAPDERQHANYVQHVLDGSGFPVFTPGDADGYENHQAPAYYVLAAGFCKALGIQDLSQPEGARLRWLNAIVGFGTVLGVFFLGLWGFQDSKIALGAAAFAAFLPMLCALDGAISNDPLLYCALTWSLALLARGIRTGWDWKLAIALGFVAGIALNSKTTAIVILPTAIVAFFLGKRPSATEAIVSIAIALALATPWWLRNVHIYGDPLALKAFVTGFNNPHPQDIIPHLQGGAFEYWTSWFGWWTVRSFFGAFGYMDIFLNATGSAFPPPRSGDTEILYRLLLLGSVLASFGFLASLRDAQWKEARPVHLMNFVALLLVFGVYLKFNMTYFQAQGRYILPAIGPLACGISIGVDRLSGRRLLLGIGLMASILLGVNGYALVRLPQDFAVRTQLDSP